MRPKAVTAMAKNKLVKCRYSHCKHPQDMKPPEEMAQSGSTVYYHPECLREKDTINQIVKYYLEKIDFRAIISQLRKVINDIVFKKGVPADELLFDVMYIHKSQKKLNSPFGLHYVVTNKKIQYEYQKQKRRPVTFNADKVATKEETEFTSSKKKTGFDNIF